MQRILDGDHGRVDLFLTQTAKNVFKTLTRQDFHATAEQTPGRFLTESPTFSLKSRSFKPHRSIQSPLVLLLIQILLKFHFLPRPTTGSRRHAALLPRADLYSE